MRVCTAGRKGTEMAKRAKGKARPAARRSNPPLTVSRPELLEGGSDRKFRLLINGLFALFSTASSVRDGYAECLGLAGPQYTIMLCIRHLEADGVVNVSTIAEHTRMSGSFITVETSKLKEAGTSMDVELMPWTSARSMARLESAPDLYPFTSLNFVPTSRLRAMMTLDPVPGPCAAAMTNSVRCASSTDWAGAVRHETPNVCSAPRRPR